MKRQITELNIYPLKSGGAMSVPEIKYGPTGPLLDRQWMLVDTKTGKFVSQRNFPQMARLKPRLIKNKLEFKWDNKSFELDLEREPLEIKHVDIWTKLMLAHEEPKEISKMISEFLGSDVTLVRHGSQSDRNVLVESKPVGSKTRFSDSQQILIANTKSLEELNSKLTHKIPMNRFRSNVIFDGERAFEEETFKVIKLPNIELEFTKACARCVIITTDQETGERKEKDPIQELKQRNVDGGKVLFGVYAHALKGGIIRVGDSFTV